MGSPAATLFRDIYNSDDLLLSLQLYNADSGEKKIKAKVFDCTDANIFDASGRTTGSEVVSA